MKIDVFQYFPVQKADFHGLCLEGAILMMINKEQYLMKTLQVMRMDVEDTVLVSFPDYGMVPKRLGLFY